MTPATAQDESAKKMWIEYMKEAEKYDNRAADSWKDDSTGILVFVRLGLTGSAVHRDDNPEDRSFLCNRWCIYHRILQKAVSR